MEELTTDVPKPMLEIHGKPLLEYKLDALPDDIEEVIIVVGYLGARIRGHFGSMYNGKRITYIEQKDRNGTAGALWEAKGVLSAGGATPTGRQGSVSGGKDRFLVMMGDDIYTRSDIEACIAEGNVWRLVVQQIPEMHRSGNVILDADAHIKAIVEGDLGPTPGLASTNMFLLDTRIFSCPLVPKLEGSLEYGLPQTVLAGAMMLGIPLEPVFTDQWIQITSPKDLVKAATMLDTMKK